LAVSEALSEQIREYNQRIENLAEESYPEVKLLKQVKGVGTLVDGQPNLCSLNSREF
jgi:hypothetical protein